MPELTEPTLLVAGWVNVSLTPWPEGFDPSVPDPFLTISDCLADDLVTPEFSGWFQSLDEAVLARVGTARVIGIGLADATSASFIEDVADDRHFDRLRHREVVSQPTLGFEIVGAEACLFFHSWHCHGYATEVLQNLGVRLNDLGLIAAYADAMRVLDWMLSRPLEEQPEPVPWTVAALWQEPA